MRRPTTLACCCLFASCTACLALTAGCGKSDSPRRRLSGTVTFQGRPIPAGQILFEPDFTKANDGPQGMARIVDGHYDTDEFDKGPVAGALLVRISGYEAADAAGASDGPRKPLFLDYVTRVTLGEDVSTLDFDVPSEAANRGPAKWAQ